MYKAVLIDCDGVLYRGDAPIPGAADAVAWLAERDVPHLFVTNTTSRPRAALVEKLRAMGIAAPAERILTPPVAAARWLAGHAPGAAALFVAPETVGDFTGVEPAGSDRADVAAVVVGDYGERWSFDELNRAFRLLMARPQPALVALGMTRYWQAPEGLRLDTAPFVVALAHASGAQPVVLGKPAEAFFRVAIDRLGVDAGEVLMIGDDIRGDVGGAQSAGLGGALVKTGKFREDDLRLGVEPDLVLASIAELPQVFASGPGPG